MNHSIDGNVLTLDIDCARLQSSLRISAGKVATNMRNAKGFRERSKIHAGVTCVVVSDGEVLNTATLEQRLELAQIIEL